MQQILPEVERAGILLVKALQSGKKILICGNGGSAADSQHFAAELVGRFVKKRRGLPALSLTVDGSAVTAIGNDYGVEYIFARQVEALGSSGDLLVAFSTSGSSKNILAAAAAASKRKMKIVGLTGEKGKLLASVCDVIVVIPTSETARIQEVHELVYHAWCEYIDAHF